jgi:hypothetical protein
VKIRLDNDLGTFGVLGCLLAIVLAVLVADRLDAIAH